MKGLVETAVRQPITVAVAIILIVLAGVLAVTRVPIQLTPEVDSVVITVTTYWENASPAEIESDVVEEQEQRLGDISGVVSMTSMSQAGMGEIRLEFRTGTDIGAAMAEVDQKLSEVPSYPEGVDEPQVEDVDPESVDYIAWVGLSSTDPDFDTTTLYDFMEKRLRPRFERIPGIAQVGMHGGREREVHVRVDPVALAERGITYANLLTAIDLSNDNYSAGKLPDGKSEIRVRTVGRFRDIEEVTRLVLRRDPQGPVYLEDVAEIVDTHKELTGWVRARGHWMPFFNFQLAVGANLLETMAELQAEFEELNAPGGLLERHAQKLGLNGTLELVQTYDATQYVNDALALVRNNIFIGGFLATMALLFFLRSLRTIGIIAIAIPISVLGSIIVGVTLGRSVNIVSLAGMAFAVGMVVDNAIVVIENIFRHLEMGGKTVRQATLDATREVSGAVLASTLTTMVVFFPILLIQEAAGQLFRDIALAIMAAVGFSFVVAMTVIPSAAALALRWREREPKPGSGDGAPVDRGRRRLARLTGTMAHFANLPARVSGVAAFLAKTWPRRAVTVLVFAAVTIGGILWLTPPLDYLPRGNRNIVFGMLIPPPGYTIEQLSELGERLEERIRPAWEIAGDRFKVEQVVRADDGPVEDRRVPISVGYGSDEKVLPPALDHYFLVGWSGRVFHGAVALEKRRIADARSLLDYAAAGGNAPDVLSFSFQVPLFRTGGTSGSAIKLDLIGDDIEQVSAAGGAFLGALAEAFGPYSTQPEPSNFLLPVAEIQIVPDDERLRDLGMSRRDVGLAAMASGDGILIVRSFEIGGELKDLKIITPAALGDHPIEAMLDAPLATPDGNTVNLGSIARIERVSMPDRIKHVDRQRAVTLQLTPPPEMPLEAAIAKVDELTTGLRASGALTPAIEVRLSGSAGQLAEMRAALMGDGSVFGFTTSSLFLAFFVVYLLLVVLFQSWAYPLVIMVSVPLATLGGFIGLAIVHRWSLMDRYTPIQNLDVLTILGFVILAGVVVNNAILIVHQSLRFHREGLAPGKAVNDAVRSRVRPILMSMLTSVGGMMPLVLMPGSGSELYRGLGAVVTGGLIVSTVFTLLLVPVLLTIVMELKERRGYYAAAETNPADRSAKAITRSGA